MGGDCLREQAEIRTDRVYTRAAAAAADTVGDGRPWLI